MSLLGNQTFIPVGHGVGLSGSSGLAQVSDGFSLFTWWRPFPDNASPATALSNEAFLQLKKIDTMQPNILIMQKEVSLLSNSWHPFSEATFQKTSMSITSTHLPLFSHPYFLLCKKASENTLHLAPCTKYRFSHIKCNFHFSSCHMVHCSFLKPALMDI